MSISFDSAEDYCNRMIDSLGNDDYGYSESLFYEYDAAIPVLDALDNETATYAEKIDTRTILQKLKAEKDKAIDIANSTEDTATKVDSFGKALAIQKYIDEHERDLTTEQDTQDRIRAVRNNAIKVFDIE